MTLLEARDLKAYYITKSYGIERTVHAVDDISLDVNTDEILGIAGRIWLRQEYPAQGHVRHHPTAPCS